MDEFDRPGNGTLWEHSNGCIYQVEGIANDPPNEPHVLTVVYRGIGNGKLWTRPLSDWHRSMKPLSN